MYLMLLPKAPSQVVHTDLNKLKSLFELCFHADAYHMLAFDFQCLYDTLAELVGTL